MSKNKLLIFLLVGHILEEKMAKAIGGIGLTLIV